MRTKLNAVLTDDNKRKELQYNSIFLLFFCVSLFMTVLNVITRKGALTIATAVFAVLCLVNFLLIKKGGKTGTMIASVLFSVEMVALFTFFLISGNPDGFSALWIAMLPACGMLLFGRKRAAILSGVMFAILIFFFWIPAGRSLLQYEYNKTFMMRFPIFYLAFFLLSALLETIRSVTQKELDKLREKYKYYAAHDYLTNLLNRQGLEEWYSTFSALGEQAVLMIDIDHFKNVNDSCGHDVGDLVLASVAREIQTGATVLDYAFLVSPKMGLRFRAAKINQSGEVGPETILSYDDKVYILTDEKETACFNWLRIVRTRHAREVLASYFEKKYQE